MKDIREVHFTDINKNAKIRKRLQDVSKNGTMTIQGILDVACGIYDCEIPSDILDIEWNMIVNELMFNLREANV